MSAAISRTGSLIQNEPWTKFLSDYGSITLRQYPALEFAHPRMQFVGWNIDSADPARVIPQFFPFHPVLLAVGFSLFGVYGALYVTPLWGVLGIGAVYLLGKRLSGPPLGLLAAVLLAITPVQIYFSRYPTTEPLTLLLVFFGLWAFQTLRDDTAGLPDLGSVGGAALGAALLTGSICP